MNTVGIIGYGFVGEATVKGFATNKENKLFWYDKYKQSPNTLEEVVKLSEFIFICLPTPMFRDYSGQDISIVEDVIKEIAPKLENTEKVLIIKSTVLPTTTQKLADKYQKVNFIMNPEFLTQSKANEDFLKPARTVIGGSDDGVKNRVMNLYKSILEDQKYFLVGLTEAEMIKYMSNIMLASKVLLANEFYELSEKIGANYKEVYKAVEADPRIGSHLNVPGPDGDLGFGGACFPKDTLGLLSFAKQKEVDMSALNGIWEKNLKIRKNKDWEHMDNAFGRGASNGK